MSSILLKLGFALTYTLLVQKSSHLLDLITRNIANHKRFSNLKENASADENIATSCQKFIQNTKNSSIQVRRHQSSLNTMSSA